jgi:hypothetical protein
MAIKKPKDYSSGNQNSTRLEHNTRTHTTELQKDKSISYALIRSHIYDLLAHLPAGVKCKRFLFSSYCDVISYMAME